MANEDTIQLTLEIKARGAAGVTTEVKKLEGTVDELKKELKDLSQTSSGFGNKARQDFASVSRSLEKLTQEAQAAGKALTALNATGIGTKNARASATVTGVGSGTASRRAQLAATRAAHAEALALDRQFEAQKRAQAREALAQDRLIHQQALDEDKLFNARKRQEQREEIRRQQAIHQEALDLNRQFDARKKAEAAESARKFASLGATAGFVGLNISKSLGNLLDPAVAKGILAPKIKELSTVFGGLFGDTFGSIAGNLGDAVGRIFESILDSITGVLRVGLKFVSGLFIGLFTSIIGIFTGGGYLNLIIGLIGGLVDGIIKAFTQLLQEVVSIVGNLLGAITALISGGLKIVVSIFEGITNFISGLWRGFWEGLKSVAEFSMDAIQKVVSVVLDQLGKGFEDFIEKEKLATKSFENIADSASNFSGGFQGGIEAIEALGDHLRTTYGVTKELAQSGIFDTTSGKFKDLAEATQVLDAAGRLHVATQADFKTTTEVLNTTLIAFNRTADQSVDTARELANAARLGRTDLQRFSESFAPAAVAASQAGVSLEEYTAAVSVATLSGLTASQANVGFQRILNAINDPTKKNADTFKEYGVALKDSTGKARDFFDIIKDLSNANPEKLRGLFGTIQGVRFFRAIKDNIPLLEKFKETIGGDKTTFDSTLKNVNNQFFQLLDIVTEVGKVIRENLGGGFGEVFRKPLQEIVPLLQRLQLILTGDNVKKFFTAFTDFASPIVNAVLDPIIGALNSITEFIEKGDFSSFFDDETVKNVRDAIVNIETTIVEIIRAIPSIVSNFSGFGDIVKKIYEDYIKPIFQYLGDKEAVQNLKNGFNQALTIAKEIKDVITRNLLDPTLFKANFDTIVRFMKTAFVSIGKFLYDTLVDAFDLAASFFVIVLGARLKEAVRSIFQNLFSTIGSFLAKQAKDADARIAEREKNPYEGSGADNILDSALASSASGLAGLFGRGAAALAPSKVEHNSASRDVTIDKLSEFLNEFKNNKNIQGQINNILVPGVAQSAGVTNDSVTRVLTGIRDNPNSVKKFKDSNVVSSKIIDALTDELSQNGSTIGAIKGNDQDLGQRLQDLGTEIRTLTEELKAKNHFQDAKAGFADRQGKRNETVIGELGTGTRTAIDELKAQNSPASPANSNSTPAEVPPLPPADFIEKQTTNLDLIRQHLKESVEIQKQILARSGNDQNLQVSIQQQIQATQIQTANVHGFK